METNKDIIKEPKKTIPENQEFYNYVFLKSKKLSAALYLITDILSDSEPLKWTIRNTSLELVSEASLIKDKNNLGGWPGLERLQKTMHKILSFLEVASWSGVLSTMNCQVLQQELTNLFTVLKNNSQPAFLQQALTVGELPASELDLKNNLTAVTFKTWLDPMSSAPESVTKTVLRSEQSLRSLGQKDIKHTSSDLYKSNGQSEKKNLRQEQILGWLKDKNWTNITDIAKAIPDCGVKTIQRELSEMVSLGLLKKQGERRWSRYMKA